MSTPNSLHQFIVGELYFALRTYLQNRDCYVFVAPFDVFFSESDQYVMPDHIVQPDLSVVCSKDQIVKNGCQGAPTLIIEVLSPSTALKDFNGNLTYIRNSVSKSTGSLIQEIVRFTFMRCKMVCTKSGSCIPNRIPLNPFYLKILKYH